MYLFSLILTSFVLSRVLGTLTPSDSVSIDCGGQQTFTCTVAGTAAWTITGLMGITVTGSTGGGVAIASARVTTPDMGLGPTSIITITGFNTSDNGGTVQCADIGSGVPLIDGMATIAVGVPSCPTNTRVTNRSNDFSSATITWDQPTNSPPVTSYDVTCNSSCTAMPCSSGSSTCRVLSVSPCEDYSVTVLPMNNCGSSTGCTNNVVPVPSQGPPQCGQGVLTRQPDGTGLIGNNSCPYFIFTPPQGSPEPSTVVVSYQLVGDPSSAGSLNCDYPIDPLMCNLNVTGGMYMVTLTPVNNCGSPSCDSQTENIPAHCSLAVTTTPANTTTPLPPAVIAGIAIGGAAAVVTIGVTGYFITILIMGCTCFASIGFLALLKCQCCKGSAMKSSSKQRMRSESPVTPAQPPAQPPADEYADPQAIRDRKEKGKEDKDKIQYAAIDFSAGAGSGAGEVKIHQKEEPVIYTTVQHV